MKKCKESHSWVVGPSPSGLYARCVNCDVLVHALSLDCLRDIGAIRVEDGKLMFSVAPEAEQFLVEVKSDEARTKSS